MRSDSLGVSHVRAAQADIAHRIDGQRTGSASATLSVSRVVITGDLNRGQAHEAILSLPNTGGRSAPPLTILNVSCGNISSGTHTNSHPDA